MPDPAELITVARDLLVPSRPGGLTDAHLRRAVSTAYYAVFHAVLRSAAILFFGESS